MKDFFAEDKAETTAKEDGSSVNTRSTDSTTMAGSPNDFEDFACWDTKPSNHSERKSTRQAMKQSYVPKRWGSTGALASRKSRFSDIVEEDGFQSFSGSEHGVVPKLSPIGRPVRANSTGTKPLSESEHGVPKFSPVGRPVGRPVRANSTGTQPRRVNSVGGTGVVVGRSRSPGRMKLVPSNLASSGDFESPFSKKSLSSHLSPGLGQDDAVNRIHMRDAFDIDPFDDSQTLGEVKDFTEGNEEDDQLFVTGTVKSSKKSPKSSIWDQAIDGNTGTLPLKYDDLKSEIEDMRKSVHNQEKEMERQIQVRDDLIKKLAEQLEVAQDDQSRSSKKSKSKKSSKKERKKDGKRLSRSEHKQERRGSTGGLSSPKAERAKRRGSTSGISEKKERMRRRSSVIGDKAEKVRRSKDSDDEEDSTPEKAQRRSSLGSSKSDKQKRRSSMGGVDKRERKKSSSKKTAESKKERQKEELTDAVLTLLSGESSHSSLERKKSKTPRRNGSLSKSSSHSRVSTRSSRSTRSTRSKTSTRSKRSEKKKRSKSKTPLSERTLMSEMSVSEVGEEDELEEEKKPKKKDRKEKKEKKQKKEKKKKKERRPSEVEAEGKGMGLTPMLDVLV